MKKVRKVLCLSIIIIMLSNTLVFAEISIDDNIKGALLGDLETGEILFEHNIEETLPLASVSKLMTYYVMMDKVYAGEVSLDDDVVISKRAANTGGSSFALEEGETVKLQTLAEGLLIVSGNDSAMAIAEHVAGNHFSFVNLMNKKAKELGLESASFINPNGLPVYDRVSQIYLQNYMSISDLYKFTRSLLDTYPEVLEITSMRVLEVPERNYMGSSTNPLLPAYEEADGLKTGFTNAAGYCLVSTMTVEGEGEGQDYRLIAIILGSSNTWHRLNKTLELMEHGIEDFNYLKLADTSKAIDEIYIGNSKLGNINVFPATDFTKMVNNEDVITTEITYNEDLLAPLSKGDVVGKVSILVNGEEVEEVDAVVMEDIEKTNIVVRMGRFIRDIFR